MKSFIERFVPSSPGPDCPMTVDAERLIGTTVQVKLLVWEIVVLLNVAFCANKGKGGELVKKRKGWGLIASLEHIVQFGGNLAELFRHIP